MATEHDLEGQLDQSWLAPVADPLVLGRVLDSVPFGVHLVRVGPGDALTVLGMNRTASLGFPSGVSAVGRDLAEVLDAAVGDRVVDPAIRDETLARYRRVHTSGAPETARFEVDFGDEHRVVDVMLVPLAHHVLALTVDLTGPVGETHVATAHNEAILRASPDRMWVVSRDLEIRHFAGGDAHGELDHASFVGRNVADVYTPEIAERTRALVDRTLDTGLIQVDETVAGEGDDVVAFETRMVPLGDDEILGFVRDITDRKRAEYARRRHARTDALTAEISRDLLASTPHNLAATAASALERMARFIGADTATLARRIDDESLERSYTWWDPAIGAEPAGAPRVIRTEMFRTAFTLMARGEPHLIADVASLSTTPRAEREMLRTVGAHSALVVPIGGAGSVIGYLTFYWRSGPVARPDEVRAAFAALRLIGDTLVTAHDRAKAALALVEADEQLRAIFDALDEGIVLVARDGTVTSANRSACEIVNLAPQELVGHRYGMAQLPLREDGTAFTEDDLPTFATLRDGEPRVNVLAGLATPSGERRWITVNTRPLVRPGETELFAVVTSFTDVTEQRRMQTQLAQAGKMEALGRLAGGVAHDFNNILTAITGYTSLLLADLPVDSELRTDLQEVEHAAERAADLVDQLLSFSRHRVLEPAVADVQDTITEMHTMLQRVLPADIELQIRFHTSSARAAIDRGQLEQVVLNLAVNAGDAMPDGGRLVLETEHVEEDDDGGPYVVLLVSDTGIGMDAATRARAFEPFFTTKEIGKGTGLGLSTVYGIVTQAGGRVSVYSEPGDGTTFRIFLPSTEDEPLADTDTHRVAGHQTGDETILVVEDDEAVRALAVETLRRRGFHVIEAGDGDAARRAAREHQGRIDLLLCDVVLPTTRGPALAAEILRNRAGIRVLFMSGYAEGIVSPSIVEGAAFLPKPFRPDELVQCVREVLDRGSSHA